MTVIIAFAGKRGSGKSEASKVLVDELGFVEMKFADPLKNMLRGMYRTCGVTDAEIERRIEGDLKEMPCPWLSGRSPRLAMQLLGTEWREMLHTDLWTNMFEKRALGTRFGNRIVVSDLRFPHEIESLHRIGAHTVGIYRPEASAVQDSYSEHISETAIEVLPIRQWIQNDKDIGWLQAQARSIATNAIGRMQ